jgi:hypothetical protein
MERLVILLERPADFVVPLLTRAALRRLKHFKSP